MKFRVHFHLAALVLLLGGAQAAMGADQLSCKGGVGVSISGNPYADQTIELSVNGRKYNLDTREQYSRNVSVYFGSPRVMTLVIRGSLLAVMQDSGNKYIAEDCQSDLQLRQFAAWFDKASDRAQDTQRAMANGQGTSPARSSSSAQLGGRSPSPTSQPGQPTADPSGKGFAFHYEVERPDVPGYWATVVGRGGPCVASGVQGITVRVDSLLARNQPPYRSMYLDGPGFTAQMTANGQTMNYPYSRSSLDAHFRMLEDYRKDTSPVGQAMTAQINCVLTSHTQYETAVLEWFKANWKSCPNKCAAEGSGLRIPKFD